MTPVLAFFSGKLKLLPLAFALKAINLWFIERRALMLSLSAVCSSFFLGGVYSSTARDLVELNGLTLGILGYGAIGQAVAQLGRPFGMQVIAHSRSLKDSIEGEVRAVDRDTLFRESDFLTLHCPLTEETDRVVNAESLATMKPTAFLINTGRGPLVDEAALASALEAGQLAGAGLDVLSSEPPAPDNPLIGAKNCFITPHLAWATKASRERLMAISVDNLRSFLQGQPTNVVNRPG